MAVEDIVNYVESNKDGHSVQDLIGEIRKAGYPDTEILQAIEILRARKAEGTAPTQAITGLDDIQKLLVTLAGFLIIPITIYSYLLGEDLFIFSYIFYPINSLAYSLGFGYFGYYLSPLLAPVIIIPFIFWFLWANDSRRKFMKPLTNGLLAFLALAILGVVLLFLALGF